MSNELDQAKPRQVKISDPDEEPKTYINFYCCKLSLNIIYTICYVTAAVALNIVNRIVFYTYNFNQYNFTFMLLQQLFCIIFFYFIVKCSNPKPEKFHSKIFLDLNIIIFPSQLCSWLIP